MLYNILKGGADEYERIISKVITNDKSIRNIKRRRVQQTYERLLNIISREFKVHSTNKRVWRDREASQLG